VSVALYVVTNSDITCYSTTRDGGGGAYIDFPSGADPLDDVKRRPSLPPTLTEYLMRAGNKTAAPVRNGSPVVETGAMVTIDASTGDVIAAGRYRRIPAGHDAPGIASGDARRRKKHSSSIRLASV
jgi:hypothetical protein